LAGWCPLPLSVRDARRLAGPLRDRLPAGGPTGAGPVPGAVVAAVRGLTAGYGRRTALAEVDLTLHEGEVVAVMGRNGAGKSTLLHQLVGLRPPDRGSVRVRGEPPSGMKPADAVRSVGLVPQDAGALLGAETVAAECAASDADAGLPAGTTRVVLDRLLPGLPTGVHPRDLSEGQRLALALAVVVAPAPPLLLLDEPTRGLDYGAKARLGASLRSLAAAGHAVVVATHDVELAAEVADRVVVLADGEVIADGSARDVVSHSPGFAPQVARILAPAPWLTVAEVQTALGAGRSA
jgi:energy-coupling factor transport system ATP-binding protein